MTSSLEGPRNHRTGAAPSALESRDQAPVGEPPTCYYCRHQEPCDHRHLPLPTDECKHGARGKGSVPQPSRRPGAPPPPPGGFRFGRLEKEKRWSPSRDGELPNSVRRRGQAWAYWAYLEKKGRIEAHVD